MSVQLVIATATVQHCLDWEGNFAISDTGVRMWPLGSPMTSLMKNEVGDHERIILVNIHKAIENGHWNSGFIMIYPLKMVIFHSYVSLPEGNHSAGYEIITEIWIFLSTGCTISLIFPIGCFFSRKTSEDCRSCRQSWAPTSPIYRWFSH